MLVEMDIDKLLEKQIDIASRHQRCDCDKCDKGTDFSICHKCINEYLENRQTLEDIRRM